MFVLSVMFDVHPDHVEDFKAAAVAQANNTLANEKGCLGFTVFQAEGRPDRFYFHEVYENKAALDVDHQATAYLAAFRAAIAPWVLARSAERWEEAK